LGSAACNNEFSPEQVRVLQDKVIAVKGMNISDDLEYCNYLKDKYHIMNVYDKEKKIKDRFKYLCAMLDKDIKEKGHS
jgi:hypothetical protein